MFVSTTQHIDTTGVDVLVLLVVVVVPLVVVAGIVMMLRRAERESERKPE
jgi:hypothetical protein